MILGRTLSPWNPEFLEFVQVSGILFVAAVAESEVVALRAVEAEHFLGNRFQA